MTKKELLDKVLENHKQGIYGAPLMILELYTDDEEVDEIICEMLLTPPSPPPQITMYVGYGVREEMDKMLKDFIKP